MIVRPSTAWVYVGHGPGLGLLHLVVHSRSGEVITWSEPLSSATASGARDSAAGFSWMGTTDEFLRNFKRC